ncbi:MAG: DUF1080 domain-containing protein, partial [Pirellulales bacterium]|nr:DUF1080 domain-containing protein [Pirellulales bacterium]
TVRPVSRSGEPWWKQRHEQTLARLKQGNVNVIFVGDSITQGWEGAGREVWRKYYAPRGAANLGFSGDRTQHVLWRLENGQLDGIAPRLAVVMIGTNNSGRDAPEDIAAGIEKIVETLRAKLPETKILLLAIFPRGPDNDDPLRQVNEKTNVIIAQLADGDAVVYEDIGRRFLKPDGALSRDVMPDLLHLTPAAYRVWAESIEPAVARALGDLPKPNRARKEAAEPSPAEGTNQAAETGQATPLPDGRGSGEDGSEEGFVALFDGKTLDGWIKRGGGATYAVEDGTIVGRVGPGGNTFLCTPKQYADFVLKLDLKLDVPFNSGIQFRSHARKNGRVFGYQCEVDPSARAWSGGIFDEARRGWLAPMDKNEAARKAFRLDDWNEYVIRAVGPRIQTWVNGVPCADLTDAKDAKGFIALQVHAARKGQIRWRNIRIKELNP